MRIIHFVNNQIGDEGFKAFIDKVYINNKYKLENLAEMNLGSNKITSIGFEHLLKNMHLFKSIR